MRLAPLVVVHIIICVTAFGGRAGPGLSGPGLSSSVRLSGLLNQFNVTTSELSAMSIQAYYPQTPRAVNEWEPTVVTQKGAIVQAVLFESEGTRVLSFQGVDANAADPANNRSQYVNPYDACLAAKYGFVNTDAEASWVELCSEHGPVEVSLQSVAAEAGALITKHTPTVLTGHSDGCRTALSEGVIHGLPVICFASTTQFNPAWLKHYTGLADAARNVDLSQMFALDAHNDPYSNCLRFDPPNSGPLIAELCTFPPPAPGCDLPVPFSADLFSTCAEQSHWAANTKAVPAAFDDTACSASGRVDNACSRRKEVIWG